MHQHADDVWVLSGNSCVFYFIPVFFKWIMNILGITMKQKAFLLAFDVWLIKKYHCSSSLPQNVYIRSFLGSLNSCSYLCPFDYYLFMPWSPICCFTLWFAFIVFLCGVLHVLCSPSCSTILNMPISGCWCCWKQWVRFWHKPVRGNTKCRRWWRWRWRRWWRRWRWWYVLVLINERIALCF